ncbi:hypothetical protein C8024_17565 [Sphingopyxis sp. BSNA05]|uniref:hypothetical protein n=1 Tax=Sphingopyxis sp. BSNA05 TaxID=1236614 RepID=UPI001567259F|nr:hypothetical protein [Sphingopyxis sp. BSNA05]NRD90866.1 hypothetical protein [Sphingopyxis sp. BSNA05]
MNNITASAIAPIEKRSAATAGAGQSPAIDLISASPIGKPAKATSASVMPPAAAVRSREWSAVKISFLAHMDGLAAALRGTSHKIAGAIITLQSY